MKISPPPIDPYEGQAVSAVTSNIIDGRHAFDFTLSVWTSAGTTSAISLQISNSGQTQGAIAAASWSNFTSFSPSATTFFNLPLGARWYRLLRDPSLASFEFSMQKYEE